MQVEAFKSAGFLHRKSLQYHWRNRDRKTDSSSAAVINNNNGAGTAAAATDSTVVLGATPTMTPSEEAQRVVNAAREGDDGSSNKYVDFDSYLGNFASKRRIKVGGCFRVVCVFCVYLRPRGGRIRRPLLLPVGCCAGRAGSRLYLWGCIFSRKTSSSPNGEKRVCHTCDTYCSEIVPCGCNFFLEVISMPCA